MSSPSIHIRSMVTSDIALICNSWLESYRDSKCRETWGWSKDEYCEIQTKVIKQLMKHCNVAVACDPEDHDHVFGWCAWEDHDSHIIVHYAYTKLLFQRMGVQRTLWNEVVNPDNKKVFITHVTPASWELKAEGHNFLHKPFALAACLMKEDNK